MEQNPGWKQARPKIQPALQGARGFHPSGPPVWKGRERPPEPRKGAEGSPRVPQGFKEGDPRTLARLFWGCGSMARLGAQAARSSTPKPRGAAAAPQMRARLLHLFSPKLRTPTSQNRTPSKATSCSLKQKWGVGYRHPTPSQTRHRSCHRPSGPGGRIGAALGRAGGGERTPRVRAPAGIQPKGSRLPPKRWQDAAIVLGVGVRGGGFHPGARGRKGGWRRCCPQLRGSRGKRVARLG